MNLAADKVLLDAHRAIVRAREDDNWWGSPLDTALAAVIAVRRQPRQEVSDAIVRRLLRWWQTGQARATSDDAAATALIAYAAKQSGQLPAQLLASAVSAAQQAAARDITVVPSLHIALIAWALDELGSDVPSDVWKSIHERGNKCQQSTGLEAALCQYLTVANRPDDALRVCVQQVTTLITKSLPLEDICVAVWLSTAIVERASRELSGSDPVLIGLIDRRAELIERIAEEIVEYDSATDPGYEVDEEIQRSLSGYPVVLSITESLLLAIGLRSKNADSSWLKFEEAEALFGNLVEQERVCTTKWRKLAHGAIAILAVMTGLVVTLASLLVSLASSPAIWFGIATLSLILVSANYITQRRSTARKNTSLVSLFLTILVVSLLMAGNGLLDQPLFPDPAGLVGGALVSAGVAAITAMLERRRNVEN